MFALLLGVAMLVLLLGGMGAFERASIRSVKLLVAWVAALGGLSLGLLLVISGRGLAALSGLLLFGPLIWTRLRRGGAPGQTGPGQAGVGRERAGRAGQARMSRQQAYEVLGLRPGASTAEVRDAHRRLMRAAHPDAGGSDWLASQVNQARDVLLG